MVRAILFADLHLLENRPICRTDDIEITMINKLSFIQQLQIKHECPVFFSGDLTEKWKVSPWLISLALRYLPKHMIGVPGNHDLPAHNLNRLDESAYWALVSGGRIDDLSDGEEIEWDDMVVRGFPFGTKLMPTKPIKGMKQVAIVHHYVYKGRKPFPGQLTGVTSLMRKLKGYDLILTGDNHLPFTHKSRGQLLVNPGSIFRWDADQIDDRPRVYLWYDDNTIEPIFLPIEQGVISRDHIDIQNKRDERIVSFIARLNNQTDIGLSFKKNMDRFIRENQDSLNRRVISKIREAMDNE
jgi:predicted phosphodiesterase